MLLRCMPSILPLSRLLSYLGRIGGKGYLVNWLILLVAFNMVGAVMMFADGKNNLIKASSNPDVPL